MSQDALLLAVRPFTGLNEAYATRLNQQLAGARVLCHTDSSVPFEGTFWGIAMGPERPLESLVYGSVIIKLDRAGHYKHCDYRHFVEFEILEPPILADFDPSQSQGDEPTLRLEFDDGFRMTFHACLDQTS